jgi:flagellar protein FliO/FliZ
MPDTSVLALLARLVLSLGVVIGLMLLLASVLRKRGIVVGGARGKGRPGKQWDIDILARRGLGRQAQVAVVRAAGRTMVVGITEQRISLLGEGDPDTVAALQAADEIAIDGGSQWTALPSTEKTGTSPTWKTLLDTVRDRTVRH